MPLSHQFLIFANKQLDLRLTPKCSTIKFATFAGKQLNHVACFFGLNLVCIFIKTHWKDHHPRGRVVRHPGNLQVVIQDKSWTTPGEQFLIFAVISEDVSTLSVSKHSEAVISLPCSPSPQLSADTQIAHTRHRAEDNEVSNDPPD
ncbi:hypothetical protein BD410DRAFT_834405 [Rickenella mellea]|uniref:Uncharacterized protein n=1 Tax=Rickenella mellea TaxID=50990 RepID=A0A4R5XHU1_9AGAM|nr:hypothetical protein BD410DRAFT_834405 [Rickenella mellea]